jgi:hypothetical protein
MVSIHQWLGNNELTDRDKTADFNTLDQAMVRIAPDMSNSHAAAYRISPASCCNSCATMAIAITAG